MVHRLLPAEHPPPCPPAVQPSWRQLWSCSSWGHLSASCRRISLGWLQRSWAGPAELSVTLHQPHQPLCNTAAAESTAQRPPLVLALPSEQSITSGCRAGSKFTQRSPAVLCHPTTAKEGREYAVWRRLKDTVKDTTTQPAWKHCWQVADTVVGMAVGLWLDLIP